MADMTEERDSLSWSWTCDGAAIVRCRKGGDKAGAAGMYVMHTHRSLGLHLWGGKFLK